MGDIVHLVWKKDYGQTLVDEVLKIFRDRDKAVEYLGELVNELGLHRIDFPVPIYGDSNGCEYTIEEKTVE